MTLRTGFSDMQIVERPLVAACLVSVSEIADLAPGGAAWTMCG
jgi:hypothetical protein